MSKIVKRWVSFLEPQLHVKTELMKLPRQGWQEELSGITMQRSWCVILPYIHCNLLLTDGPQQPRKSPALIEHLMHAGIMLGAGEGDRRQTSEGGENPTRGKLNGGFGCWDLMSPSEGAKHLEQSGQVQTQSQRD